jgi:hypothetical protein
MVNRWISLGYTQELNKDNIPNAGNLVESLRNPDFDPGRVHSLPWQGGFAGIAYNVEETGEVRSVSDLWRPDLNGRVGVLSEMRDTIGVIMLENGVDISSDFSADDFNAALDIFREQVESGQIRNVRGNAYTEDLVNGDTLAAICWSGDITLLNFEAGYEKWKFVLPEGGATLWNDNFLIPIGSPRKTNAETLINYYYELHHAGRGRLRGRHRDRPRARREPAHLPQRRHPGAGEDLPRSHRSGGERVPVGLPGHPARLVVPLSTPTPEGAPPWCRTALSHREDSPKRVPTSNSSASRSGSPASPRSKTSICAFRPVRSSLCSAPRAAARRRRSGSSRASRSRPPAGSSSVARM